MRPNIQSMLGAISSTLQTVAPQMTTTLRGAAGRPSAGVDDVYECFVLFEILEELNGRGAAGFAAQPANQPIDFRRSPGNFASAPARFSYIEFTMANLMYEAHISTKVASTAAGAMCELDIAIFDGAVRNRQGIEPLYSDVRLFVEAKYYTNDLDIGIARAFIGLCHRMARRTCFCTLATCAGINPNAKSLVEGRWRRFRCHDQVSPNRVGTANLRADIANSINQIFA